MLVARGFIPGIGMREAKRCVHKSSKSTTFARTANRKYSKKLKFVIQINRFLLAAETILCRWIYPTVKSQEKQKGFSPEY